MKRVVSLYLPRWPTDRLRRQKARCGQTLPPDRPFVTAMQDGQRRVLAAVDAAAAERGLVPGMPVGHAQAMIPDLAILPADPVGEARDLRRLAVWCLRFGPIAAPAPPDGVWLDATGLAALYGGEAALLEAITSAVTAQGFVCRAAVADTAGAAHALARFGTLTILPPGETAARLRDVPVAALRLTPPTVQKLGRLGIRRIGALAALPRATVSLRFGAEVGRRLDQALGRDAEPIEPVTAPEIKRSRLAFAEPILAPHSLRGAIEALARSLCRALEQAGLGARLLDLHCHRVDGQIEAVRIGTSRPNRDARHLARLLIERLDTVDPGFGIEAMVLAAVRVETLSPRQIGADPITGEGGGDLGALVDRLANRLGEDRLYRMAPVESDLPERSVRRVGPLAPPGGITWPASLPRPARLLAPPERIAVTSLLPDHPPALFIWRHAHHRVRRADGPERVFGEWWRHPGEVARSRDYFQVEDDGGARFWLFRHDIAQPCPDSEWFLHGLFG